LVEKSVVECVTAEDAAKFEFELPEGPSSFHGALIGIDWAVEAVLLPTGENSRAVFSFVPR
jgi:hypothetical protein